MPGGCPPERGPGVDDVFAGFTFPWFPCPLFRGDSLRPGTTIAGESPDFPEDWTRGRSADGLGGWTRGTSLALLGGVTPGSSLERPGGRICGRLLGRGFCSPRGGPSLLRRDVSPGTVPASLRTLAGPALLPSSPVIDLPGSPVVIFGSSSRPGNRDASTAFWPVAFWPP